MSNHLDISKKRAVLQHLVEGCSIRTTERCTGVNRNTVMALLARLGAFCVTIMDEYVRGVGARSIHLDEIWAFVGKKQRRCSPAEKASGQLGDQYTWVALDRDTKLVISYTVGQRDAVTAKAFCADLASRVVGRPTISSDGFEAYVDAIDEAFGADCDYGQIIKMFSANAVPGRGRYSPPKISGTKKYVINGEPDLDDLGTSHVERQNLTIRMEMRRFTRLTNGFSKKLSNLRAAVALHFCHYNFCRIHQTLGVTPAMEAGLTDHVWDVLELLDGEANAGVAIPRAA
jgi:IS1 family transposase